MVERPLWVRQQADAHIAAPTDDDDGATDDDAGSPVEGEVHERPGPCGAGSRGSGAGTSQTSAGTASVGAGLTPWR